MKSRRFLFRRYTNFGFCSKDFLRSSLIWRKYQCLSNAFWIIGSTYNKTTLQKDIDTFTRRIKLKAHFNNENEPTNGRKKEFYIKSNSSWTPYNPHHTVKTFVEAFSNEIRNLPDTTVNKRENNLTKKGKNSPGRLSKTRRYSHYQSRQRRCSDHPRRIGLLNEANRQLGDINFYKKCNRDLTDIHNKQVN